MKDGGLGERERCEQVVVVVFLGGGEKRKEPVGGLSGDDQQVDEEEHVPRASWGEEGDGNNLRGTSRFITGSSSSPASSALSSNCIIMQDEAEPGPGVARL